MAVAKGAAAKAAKGQGSAGQSARPGRKGARNRRAPAQLLADLRAERATLAERYGTRLAKLDERIQRVEARYETQLALAELTEGASLDDLQRQLEDAKRQQQLLRMALKTKR